MTIQLDWWQFGVLVTLLVLMLLIIWWVLDDIRTELRKMERRSR